MRISWRYAQQRMCYTVPACKLLACCESSKFWISLRIMKNLDSMIFMLGNSGAVSREIRHMDYALKF